MTKQTDLLAVSAAIAKAEKIIAYNIDDVTYNKEDTEVFEGDILHHQIQTEYTFIVKYDKDKGRWYGDGLSRTYRIDITKEFLQYYKVIGNIYENPELIENKGE